MKSRKQQDQSPSKRSKYNKKFNSVERSKERSKEMSKELGDYYDITAECYKE